MPSMMATAERSLRRGEWVALGILSVPTFAFALAITTVSTYLPVLASSFASSAVLIGALIGGEGLMALALPVLVGSWSDRLATPIGGRLPFVLGATPVVALSLALLGFVNSIGAAALGLAIFFAGYFVAYEPYRALYPDLLGDEVAGRAQSTQAMSRGLATVVALAAGGVLLSVGRGVPFVAGGAVVAVSVAAFGYVVLRRGVPEQDRQEDVGARTLARRLLSLLREHGDLRAFLAANALWELSLAALKTFVLLYVTKAVGMSTSAASLVVAGVAVVVLLASPVSGKLGDRIGRAKVMTWSLAIYGIGLVVPFATTNPALLVPVLPIVAFGGGVIMTLPYALLMPMMPPDEHGALTGFYSVSRGIGVALGPALAGAAIEVAGQDYRAMWLVCAAGVLASIPFTRRLRKNGDESATRRPRHARSG
jgi:MFS family permease